MHVGLVQILGLPPLFGRPRFATAVRSASVVLSRCFRSRHLSSRLLCSLLHGLPQAASSDLPLALACAPLQRRPLAQGNLWYHCNNEGTHVPGGDNDDNATKTIAVMPNHPNSEEVKPLSRTFVLFYLDKKPPPRMTAYLRRTLRRSGWLRAASYWKSLLRAPCTLSDSADAEGSLEDSPEDRVPLKLQL
jgi:hypothetical protein